MDEHDTDAVAFEGEPPTEEDVAAARTTGEQAVRTLAAASQDEISKIADGEATDLPVADALDYLVGAFQDPDSAVVTRVLRVNVGAPQTPKIVRWTIRSISGARIRKIQEDARAEARRVKGQEGTNAVFAGNLRIVVEGTVDPDLRAGASRFQVADPADFLEVALQSKQGLIDQISGAILTLSGYDEDDVNDEMEAKAAGN